MSAPGRSFAIGLSSLTLLFALIAALWLASRGGKALPGALAGVAASAGSAGISYGLMTSVLRSSNLGFLRAHFAGMLLRILLLAMAGLLVWKLLDWSGFHFLIAVAATYPFFLFLEAWQLSRRLSRPQSAETAGKTQSGE